jgi:hypothetical protein
MVCLRHIRVDTLHKGDTEDDANNNNNNKKKKKRPVVKIHNDKERGQNLMFPLFPI